MSRNLKDRSRCLSLSYPDNTVNDQLVKYQKRINSYNYNEINGNTKCNLSSKCTSEKCFFRF